MTDKLKLAGAILLIFGLATAGVWWGIFQWFECKDMGHSTFYCIGHVLS